MNPALHTTAAAAPQSLRLPVEPLDPLLTSIQPGGGWCMRLELLWGNVRRRLLKTFCPRYVARMRQLRRGERNGCPHEVLDPRDLKFYQNQGGYWWAAEDDPFAWRDRLPLVRVGLAEALLLSTTFFVVAAILSLWTPWAALVPIALGLSILWFFRNPRRAIPQDAGLVVAPADGRVVSVREIDYDSYLDGPAVEIGIFLSVFDVHINRVPIASRVIGMTYRPGKFLNALLPASARENEQLAIRLEENTPPFRRYMVRQIAGAIARRIVCCVPPGAELSRGQAFGMIKLGSRTEVVLPRDASLRLLVAVGQYVYAGTSVLARYDDAAASA